LADRPWEWVLGAGIAVVWIWFALLGVKWDVLGSLVVAIGGTILLGTLYAVIEFPKLKKAEKDH
jgi:asparagine N-glycosylation enzyme membrane subunit Stt3